MTRIRKHWSSSRLNAQPGTVSSHSADSSRLDGQPVLLLLDVKPAPPCLDVKPVSPQLDVKPVSPLLDVKPASPGLEVKPVSPQLDVKPASPEFHVKPASPQLDVQPVSPRLDVQPLSPWSSQDDSDHAIQLLAAVSLGHYTAMHVRKRGAAKVKPNGNAKGTGQRTAKHIKGKAKQRQKSENCDPKPPSLANGAKWEPEDDAPVELGVGKRKRQKALEKALETVKGRDASDSVQKPIPSNTVGRTTGGANKLKLKPNPAPKSLPKPEKLQVTKKAAPEKRGRDDDNKTFDWSDGADVSEDLGKDSSDGDSDFDKVVTDTKKTVTKSKRVAARGGNKGASEPKSGNAKPETVSKNRVLSDEADKKRKANSQSVGSGDGARKKLRAKPAKPGVEKEAGTKLEVEFPEGWKYKGLARIAEQEEAVNGQAKKLCGRTDGHNWRCPLRVVEGLSLCVHHLNKARKKKLGRSAQQKKKQAAKKLAEKKLAEKKLKEKQLKEKQPAGKKLVEKKLVEKKQAEKKANEAPPAPAHSSDSLAQKQAMPADGPKFRRRHKTAKLSGL